MSITNQQSRKAVRLAKGNYCNFLLISYREAFSITRDKPTSEEIARLTVIKYILYEDKIKSASIQKWLKDTTKDKIHYYFNRIIESTKNSKCVYYRLEQKITNYIINDCLMIPEQKKLLELQSEIYSETVGLERKLLENYLMSACRICDLHPPKDSSSEIKGLQLKILRLRNLFRDKKEKPGIDNQGTGPNPNLQNSEESHSIEELYKRHSKHFKSIKLLKKSMETDDIKLLSPYMMGKETVDFDYPPIRRVARYNVLLLKINRYEIQIQYSSTHRDFYQLSLVIDFEPEKDMVIILTSISLYSQTKKKSVQ